MKIAFLTNKETQELGYFENEESLSYLKDYIKRSGLDFEIMNVNNTKSLDKILSNGVDLVFPNVYTFTDDITGEEVWMSEYLDRKGVPYIGHNKEGLQKLLDKNLCQTLLKKNNVPIPQFVILNENNMTENYKLLKNGLIYPVIVKPTMTANSIGIYKDSVANDAEEVIKKVQRVFDDVGGPEVIVEEYLPTKDITVGVMKTNRGNYVVAGYYEDSSVHHYGFKHGNTGFSSIKLVKDSELNKKLSSLADMVYDSLGLRDVTRFDCKADKDGNIKIFDVNGMPGMNRHHSSLPALSYHRFSDQDSELVYDSLINTLILSASDRYGLEVPEIVKRNNTYTL